MQFGFGGLLDVSIMCKHELNHLYAKVGIGVSGPVCSCAALWIYMMSSHSLTTHVHFEVLHK